MDVVKRFLQQVDFDRVRTAHPPELIFLCGGKKDSPQSIRPKIQAALENLDKTSIFAEDAMTWVGGQSFAKDLLELEKYYAALVSVIPLVCESFGAAAELGAFVNDDAIIHKLYVVIQEKYYSGAESESFIRSGPIKRLEDLSKKEDDNVRQIFSISDDKPENDIESVCSGILDFTPKTSKCDLSKGYYQILLLVDIISLLVIATDKEIKSTFKYALKQAGKFEYFEGDKIPEMLFVLASLRIIKKRCKGAHTYSITTQPSFYLEYRSKNSADYVKASTVRKQNVSAFYTKNKHSDQTKVSILKEEEKLGDIAWLKKDYSTDDIGIANLLKTAPMQYKVYEIPKISGGKRTIAQPTPKLKQLQRKLVADFESTFPVHTSAKAYIKNINGILDNASAHKENKFFYKFDFKNFFPSIKAKDFDQYLQSRDFSDWERIDFIKTAFRFDKSNKLKTRQVYSKFNNPSFNHNQNPDLLKLMTEDFADEFQLSIGAPSSPFISNILLYSFDKTLAEWASDNCEMPLIYTRFADDITISSPSKIDISYVRDGIQDAVNSIQHPKLILNDSKEKQASFKGRVTITGLNITPQHKVSLGRERKKLISAMIHHYKQGKLKKEDIPKLRGWLAYSKAVENSFLKSMEKKYSKELIESILRSSG